MSRGKKPRTPPSRKGAPKRSSSQPTMIPRQLHPLFLRHGAPPPASTPHLVPAHSDRCLQVGASGCPRRFARRLICGRIVVGLVCQVLSHCICNLVYEICALLCFSCRGSILQPGAEGGWQQRGLCICAMYLCQNERSDKSSDRELA